MLAGFNLVVCYFALGDKDKMKKGFLQLLMVPVEGMGDDKVGGDLLSKYYAKRQAAHSKYVLWAAKLIAPVIEETSDAGFQWLISHLKSPKPGSDAGAHVDGWYYRYTVLPPDLTMTWIQGVDHGTNDCRWNWNCVTGSRS